MSVVVKVDTADLGRLANVFASIDHHKAHVALARGINATGAKALTQMRRAMVKQTGLKYGLMVRALRPTKAHAGNLEYRVNVKGGNIRLKFFRPREGKGGVTANVRGAATFFPGAFMKSGGGGGKRGARKLSPKLNGGVFENVAGGAWGGKIKATKSGVFLPVEMTSGNTEATFYAVVQAELPSQLARALYAMLDGAGPRASKRTGRLG